MGSCIKALPFFEFCTLDVLRRLAETLEEERYEAGDIICTKNEHADKAFFLVEGKVNVMGGPGGNSIVSRMQHSRWDHATANPFFGEMALMASNPRRRATIEADTAVELFALPRTDVDMILPDFPGLEAQILKSLSTVNTVAGTSTPKSPNTKSPLTPTAGLTAAQARHSLVQSDSHAASLSHS